MIIATMPHNASVYVPSTTNVSKATDNSEVVKAVRKALSNRFGGATGINAVGSYVDTKGNLINEPVVIVSAFISEDTHNGAMEFVQEIAETICNAMSQECVMFTYDGIGYLVDGK